MITVTVSINGHVIFSRRACNIGLDNKTGLHRYKVDTGEVLYHGRSNGFVPLVKQMLDTHREGEHE
jgi:hypothetical protein